MVARWLGWLRPASLPLGERGERAAARFLKRKGYSVLARQFRDRAGEVDLIVTDQRTLVFVEVKTRRDALVEHPAEAVDLAKQRRLTRTAQAFIQQHRLHQCPVRFDIIAVTWPEAARRPTIEHFPGAFEAAE